MNDYELSAYAMAIRPFRRTEEAMGEFYWVPRFALFLGDDEDLWLRMLRLVSADFSRAWEGRLPACCEDPSYCFDLGSRSAYAARFVLEFAALGASIGETVKMTLDLHDALDREHHLLVEPAEAAELHFRATYPARIPSGTAA
ncbi:hypothetical protein LG322_05485 [Microbacterium aerolatum]|uniref:hypothetical protein n=1 Tax=Microbacterium aerolatum TaxID=153731 RepID=UPI00384DD6BF